MVRELSSVHRSEEKTSLFDFLLWFWQSKRKGLSLDEKRSKVQAIFFESQSFFQEKEIEKEASKKGVRDGKDVLKTLTDDDLVLKDKIGTSNYFWALPSTAGQQVGVEPGLCDGYRAMMGWALAIRVLVFFLVFVVLVAGNQNHVYQCD